MSFLPRRLPMFGFALALFAFLLPFLSISCAGAHVTMSGFQLATGSVPSELQSMGMGRGDWSSKGGGYSGDFFTLIALLATIGGLALSFVKGAGARWPGVLLAGLAAVSLSASRANVLTDAVKQGGGLVTIQYEMGFWLAFLACGATIAAYIVAQWDLPIWRQEREAQAVPAPVSEQV